MDIFTHSVFGALLYIIFLKDVTFEYFSIAIFFSFLPDLDVFLAPLKRIIKSNYLEHRGGSHSYIIGIIISALLSIIVSPLRNKSFFLVWLIGSIFYGLHVSMDLLTTTRIPYIFPVLKKEHCFYVEKAGSLFTMLNSIIFLILLSILYNLGADILIIRFVLNVYTAFFITYYFYRIISRVWFSSNLTDNEKYLPSVSPFSYIIFNHEITENNISSRLEKKYHFSKTNEIDIVNFILNPEEMMFFEKGMRILKQNYYYAKWTLLPIIMRNDEIFSIKFFFLETMMPKRTVFVQFDFAPLTQELVGVKRRSGPIQ
jgi:membrane-bound metal-dependent hydrolase YbcI (DUF457 family)